MKTEPIDSADVVVVGAGAAGLFAAIFAGRTNPKRRILLLDGARILGAKILVAGGGRCNVTHNEVNVEAYAGSSRNAIKKVLRRFDVADTIAFFRQMDVELKREATGKLFPVTDDARTILDALLRAARRADVLLRYPYRVQSIAPHEGGFVVCGEWGRIDAAKVILATGGKSLPKSGSDGAGYDIARSLGHSITGRVFPALVPLMLPTGHFLCGLSGITVPATLDLRDAAGKRLATFTDSTLCTHFGLSGPSVLDMSRYYLDAQMDDPDGTQLRINWLPDWTTEALDAALQSAGRASVLRWLAAHLPERLAAALCHEAGVDPAVPAGQLPRDARKTLARTVTALPLPITGSRGFTYAEVTAGGVPLSEIRLETMESRAQPGLHLCGEICDVDGRIGGYNFQWAWASGYVAGVSV